MAGTARTFAPSRPGPFDLIAAAAQAEVAELEIAEARYIKALGGKVQEHAEGLLASHPTLLHPTYNTVLNLCSTEETFGDFLSSIEAHFLDAGAPFSVLTSPASLPPDLVERLEARGYFRMSQKLWLEVMETVPPRPEDPAVEAKVTTDIDTWAATVAEGVGLTAFTPFVRDLAKATCAVPSHRLILATYKGRPVGGCEVAVDNSMAMLRHLSVIEPFRHKGIALSMLGEAYELLNDLKVVRLVTRVFQGSGAERVLERYGFVAGHLSEEYVREMPPFFMD